MTEFPWGDVVGITTRIFPGGVEVVLTVSDEAGFSQYKAWASAGNFEAEKEVK